MNYIETDLRGKPLWRRIVDFPLVTMLIALAVVIACFAIALPIAQFLLPEIPDLDANAKLDLVAIPLLIIAYKLVIRRLGEHPRDDLPLDGAGKPLLAGLGIGFVVFALVVGIAAVIGVYRVIGEGDASGLVSALIGPAIFAAISEEMVFRGILLRWIEEFAGSWAGLTTSSLLFGFAHYFNPGASVIACLWIAVEAGILLGGAYLLTRSLWLPIGIHAAWNFTQGEIFGVPVSGTTVHGFLRARLVGSPMLTGGPFGLESSVIALAVATAAGVLLVVLAVRRGELVKPRWVRRRRLKIAAA